MDLANLLAARSLIYIKMIQKEELIPGPSNNPHSENEVAVNRLVDRPGFEDCAKVFEEIRFAKRDRALGIVKAYVHGIGKS